MVIKAKRNWWKITAGIMTLLMLFIVVCYNGKGVNAEEELGRSVSHSGTNGGVEWTIYSDGYMEVDITGDLDYQAGVYTDEWGHTKFGYWPWNKADSFDDYSDLIEEVKVSGDGLTTTSLMFDGCKNLVSIDMEDFDTSSVTNMEMMFSKCSSLEEIDVSDFDTENVTNMMQMFDGCRSLAWLDLSGFDTRNLTNMNGMFYGCRSLTELDLSSFNTSKVESMFGVFSECSSLRKVILSSFNTSKVTCIDGMFDGCKSLSSLDLSSFDLSSVKFYDKYNMETTFKNCDKLVTIKTPKKLSKDKNYYLLLPANYINKAGEIRTKIVDANDVYTRANNSRFVVMYRMYNPNSGEHFYTASDSERDTLINAGWKYEGTAWKAPKTSKTPVYRLYNPNAGDHHYTTSVAEKNNLISVGWKDEGIGWYSDDNKGIALQRLYNPNAKAGSHHYTTSVAEKDNLVKVGWRYEGLAWYGMK